MFANLSLAFCIVLVLTMLDWLSSNTAILCCRADVQFISGAKYRLADFELAVDKAARAEAAEQSRVSQLAGNTSLPLVYFDVAIKGIKIGRIKMVLFIHDAPRAAEKFRALCTGEKGIVPEGREGAGLRYHFEVPHVSQRSIERM